MGREAKSGRLSGGAFGRAIGGTIALAALFVCVPGNAKSASIANGAGPLLGKQPSTAAAPAPRRSKSIATEARGDDEARGSTMPQPDLDKVDRILNDLGNAVIDELGQVPKRGYLFAQVSSEWPSVRLFVDEGKLVRMHHLQGDVVKVMSKLWRTENKGRAKALRWVCLSYDIRGKRFRAEFVYPEQLEGRSDAEAWLDQALRKRFRKKPIVELVETDGPTNSI